MAIQHVRNPGKRMPITGMEVGERPSNPFPGQTVQNMYILEDIVRVVVIGEIKPDDRQIHGPYRHREQKTDSTNT